MLKALKMSLLVENEAVAVRIIEGTSVAVINLSSLRFPYQILKGTAACSIPCVNPFTTICR